MAQAPLTYLERQWRNGRRSGGGNSLIEGSKYRYDRRWLPPLTQDTHLTVGPAARETLLTLGRWLYWNCSSVRGAINEMVCLAVGSLIPQFEGEDQEWGAQAEEWMRQHDKICDIRGWPFGMEHLRRNLMRAVLVDGDFGVVLTENQDGYPLFQCIPGHRIKSEADTVMGGPLDGYRIIDGVIVNEVGRAMAYRVIGEDGDARNYVDVPSSGMRLVFVPELADQVRGIPLLASSVFDWQDATDSRRFELLSQKLGASIGLIEHNEEGEGDRTKALLARSSSNFDGSNVSSVATETVDGLSIRYFRAGSQSKLESFRNDRPTSNQAAFRDDVIREALHGMGWEFDFSHNPTRAGGAQMRVVVDKINRRLDDLRCTLAVPTQSWLNGYRLAKAMKSGILPESADWWRWSYQGPARISADFKYDSEADIEERKAGTKTLAKSAAQRGEYWRDLRDQRQMEASDLLRRAKELAAEHEISIELALTLLEQPTANNNMPAAESTASAQNNNDEPTPNPSETP